MKPSEPLTAGREREAAVVVGLHAHTMGVCSTMRILAIVLLALAAFGCQQMQPKRVSEAAPTYVRVRNQSGTNMLNVLFQGNRFGNIQNGAMSEYQIGVFSNWEISIGFAGSTNRCRYVYVDSPGRMAWGKGWFTYVLTLHDNYGGPGQYLDVSVEQEE